MAMTIYERYGGFPTIRKVVSTFYERVFEEPELVRYFEHVEMRRLIDHQTRFIIFLMGGPASYSDEHIQRVHANLGISLPEFDTMVELLSETLEDFELEDADIAHVRQELRRRESLIVTAR